MRRSGYDDAVSARRRPRTYILFPRNATFPPHQIRFTILLLRAGVETDGVIQAPLPPLLHESSASNASHNFYCLFSPLQRSVGQSGEGCRVWRGEDCADAMFFTGGKGREQVTIGLVRRRVQMYGFRFEPDNISGKTAIAPIGTESA